MIINCKILYQLRNILSYEEDSV